MSRAVLPGLEVPDSVLESEIRVRLADVEKALAEAVRMEPGMLEETSKYLLDAGGKRFRPMLVLVCGYFGNPEDPRLVTASVALELTHLASLYHDDVIDEGDSRRGITSANARWDNTVAILTGDFLFARASEIMSELGNEPTRLLAKTIATLCDGQIREVSLAGKTDQTVDFYMGTIKRKTSALIATAARIGGLMSDAPVQYLDTLEGFGDELGTAFQLSDDIMDLTVSSDVLGKEPGVDMKEGVYTLPVLDALTLGEGAEELSKLLSAGPPEGDDLVRALELVRNDGSLGRSRDVVARSVDHAVELLGQLPQGPAASALIHLSEFLATRCGARR
jgi:heptaprenyl diphosphate synthase